MERISRSELNALVPSNQESNAIAKPPQISFARDTRILYWLNLAAEQYHHDIPTDHLMRFWLKSLSFFPLEAIEYAFSDYMAHEVDEWGKSWFPQVAQIVSRCECWVECEEGKSRRPVSFERPDINDPEYQAEYTRLKDQLRKIWPGNTERRVGE